MSPYDENAKVLGALAHKGRDLGTPRMIDFSHMFADRTSADAFAREAELQGFATQTERWEEEDFEEGEETSWGSYRDFPWDVTASKEMPPTCENITDTEEHLAAMARRHGGHPDGWGFFSE